MTKIAVFPGSFDPITKGHESVVKRAAPLFDKIVVAIGVNANKKYLFPLEKRIKWIEETFAGNKNVEVEQFEGLTVDFCNNIGARFILRGLRNPGDFQFENNIAQMNHTISGGIESVFLVSLPEHAPISSTIVRDIYRNNGDVSRFIPDAIRLNE